MLDPIRRKHRARHPPGIAFCTSWDMDHPPQFGWLIYYHQGKVFVTFWIVILTLTLISSSVTLKIMVANLLDRDADRETRILSLLADKSTFDSEGLRHILTLKDHFPMGRITSSLLRPRSVG